MAGIRDIRNAARARLHGAFQVPSLYLRMDPGAAPIQIGVRVHGRVVQQGPEGEMARVIEDTPVILFLVADLPDPKAGNIFSIAEGEAYEIKALDPPDGLVRRARVARLRPEKAANLPLPEGI